MYERYHIPLTPYPARASPVPKFVLKRADNCVNCGKCEKACVFGVHKRSEQDVREMADPLSHLCKNCFRCISDCPQGALSMERGPEYSSLGGGIWTPLRISTIWGEAETGKIPVLGAGYRGMFAGPGFDGMWTDMSEIVRPTRDGIHGREFISTTVDLGRKIQRLEFKEDGALASDPPPIVETQVPLMMDITRMRRMSGDVLAGWARAAVKLDTLMLVRADDIPSEIAGELNSHLVPVYAEDAPDEDVQVPAGIRMAEMALGASWKRRVDRFRKRFPETVLSARIPSGEGVEEKVLELTRSGIDVVHLDYSEDGTELTGKVRRTCSESLMAVHRLLVKNSVRDEVTVIAGGGVAAAEHVPKMMICGADAVLLERALLAALECRVCPECALDECPIGIGAVPADWVEGRTMNLVGAWRDQLLEVLGAMGIREARRLRGETGRAIFFHDLEREFFPGSQGGE